MSSFNKDLRKAFKELPKELRKTALILFQTVQAEFTISDNNALIVNYHVPCDALSKREDVRQILQLACERIGTKIEGIVFVHSPRQTELFEPVR